MRFVSLRHKQGTGWLCLYIVKRWRPIYAQWNAWLARDEGFVRWMIVDEATFQREGHDDGDGTQRTLRPLSR